MYLRTECGHNISEAVYDFAHDYVPINPVLPAPGGLGGVDTWFGRYPGARELEDAYRSVLLARTHRKRQDMYMSAVRMVREFAPVIWLAENLQVNATSGSGAVLAGRFDSRLVQALQFQNCGSVYLPDGGHDLTR